MVMSISRPLRVLPILTLTILLGTPHLVLAISPRGASAIAKSQAELLNVERVVGQAESRAFTAIGLNIAAAVLGLLAGSLPSLKRKWTKTAGLVLGIAIGSIAIVNNNIYGIDAQAIRADAAGLSEDAENLKTSAEALRTTADAEDEAAEIDRVLRSLFDIQKKRAALHSECFQHSHGHAQGKNDTAQMFTFPGEVELAASAASGIKSRPPVVHSQEEVVFTASADAAKLTDALAEAQRKAQSLAVQYFNGLRTKNGLAPLEDAAMLKYVMSPGWERESAAEHLKGAASGYRAYFSFRCAALLEDVTLMPVSGAAGAKAGTQLSLRLDRIHVDADGSAGPTGWIFSVEAAGRPLFSMPKRNFDDHRGQNEYIPTALDRAAGIVQASDADQISVVVHGKRSFGSDTATGRGTLTAKGGTLQIQVRQKADTTSGGAFVFTFTVAPIR
jgi:hypothetical protein